MRRLAISAFVVCFAAAGAHAQTAPARPAARKPAAPAAPKPAAPRPTPVAALPPAPPTDVRVVTAYTQGAQVSENTTYLRGSRQRVEFPGLVSLDQCDLKRVVLLSPGARRYRVHPYDPPPSAPAPAAASDPLAAQMAAMQAVLQGADGCGASGSGAPMPGMTPARPVPGGVVVISTTLIDTGERQQRFGLEARHIRTVVLRTPSKDACEKVPVRTEIDAWYVDLPGAASACARPTAPASEPTSTGPEECRDRTESQVAGDVTLGFPVQSNTTVTIGDGSKQETSATSADVTALEITRLDAALFEVPADFTEAKSMVELTPAVAAGGTLADAVFGSTADGTSTAAPKPAGRVRIGVLEPVNKSGRSSLQMRALRQELVTRFTRGSFDALPLKGSTVEGAAGHLSQMQCDYVLMSEVLDVKISKPGRVGGMMRMASGGGPAKDHYEVKMAYRLLPADRTATVKMAGDVKADSGGGLSLGSALRVAAFAGQMYMSFGPLRMMRGYGGMGGLGMGMGMMNPMYGLASTGGMGRMSGQFYDPRSMAMTSMAMGLTGGATGMPTFDPADQDVFQVAADASGDIAKNVTDKLKSVK